MFIGRDHGRPLAWARGATAPLWPGVGGQGGAAAPPWKSKKVVKRHTFLATKNMELKLMSSFTVTVTTIKTFQ